ncbi:ATP-binding cassette domain-containing protein [Heliobacillus mobilis]|uniref:ATP-binding cassette domain-containing protein n=1 Tax=Heliobacterium mobile TaxID=28064 RepID=A0A6I3SLX5_HELMO|nr:ABC transporter ATP-binding protein [Heliobacterium mobile]MTV49950.1 ATP-binding cassette domain-containing protein [Heliobacterium mobile]
MSLLNIDRVTKRFGGLIAVDNFSARIDEGTITGLIGPNGAGKTTVFNLLTGIYPVDEGDIFLGNQAITNQAPHRIATAGVARTFQNIRLFKELSVLDNVRIGAHSRGRAGIFGAIFRNRAARREEATIHAKAIQLLQEAGLAEYSSELAGNLSYGLQRKLEIVRALAGEPRLLILDEPAAGMNPRETEELMAFVRRLHDRGLTILLIEHDMKLVMSLCQRVIVMDHGQKIAEGPPEEIRTNRAVVEAYLGKGA